MPVNLFPEMVRTVPPPIEPEVELRPVIAGAMYTLYSEAKSLPRYQTSLTTWNSGLNG